MIHFLVGENTFMRSRALAAIVDNFEGDVQVVDGADISLSDLAEMFMATSLFSDRRLVVIKQASDNNTLWNELPKWLDKVADNVDVAVIETKLDRRTQAFKELKQQAQIQEFPQWESRDIISAASWLIGEAAAKGLALDKKSAHLIVQRVGMDQYRLMTAIEKLSLADQPVSLELIEQLIDADPAANALSLFEMALSGNASRLHQSLSTLRLNDDPYKVFGLLSSQLFSLVAVQASGEADDPSRDFGIHPYVAKKLRSYSKSLSRQKLQAIVSDFFKADRTMKTTSTDPWLLIEQVLVKIAIT